MMTDGELLKRYVTDRHEPAFTELVSRHLNLVYSAALRQMAGNAHLAQEVTQSVFVDLAHKALNLQERENLAGWLYTSVHFAATKMIRTETRRKARELETLNMSSAEAADPTEAEWAAIAPHLDDAMHELDAADRDTLLWRFFEKRPHAEIGARLGLSENAARMRVDRALVKLRKVLEGRGLKSTGAVLAVVLSSHAVSAAPAGLFAAVSTAALGTAIISTTTSTTALKIMTLTKLKAAVAGVALVSAAVTPIVIQYQQNQRLQSQLDTLEIRNAELTKAHDKQVSHTSPDASAAELDALRKEHVELLRLRGEKGVWLQKEKEIADLKAELERMRKAAAKVQAGIEKDSPEKLGIKASSGSRVTAKMKDADSWRMAGYASPEAALETQLWAKHTGDERTYLNSFAFEPETKAKLDALFAALPESVRGNAQSGEEFMLRQLFDRATPSTAVGIAATRQIAANDLTLQVQELGPDGRVGENTLRFYQYPDGWRQVIPSEWVDKMMGGLANDLSSGSAPPGN